MSPVPKAKAILRNIPPPPRLAEREPALAWDPLRVGASVFSSQEREAAPASVQGAAPEKKQVPESTPAGWIQTVPLSSLECPLAQAVPSPNILATEIQRIQEAEGWRQVLNLPATLKCARRNYRQIMLLLHPDKRQEAIAKIAGGEDACVQAYHRVQQAYVDARPELVQNSSSSSSSRSNTGCEIARPAPAPVSKHGAPTNRSSGNIPPVPPPVVPRPKSPPYRPATPPFGWGPLGPLPAPHPNVGALRIVLVE